MEENFRLCKQCGQLLPVSEFYQRRTRPTEKIHVCKKCTCENTRAYARTHPDIIKEISARGRAKHKEEIKQRNRDFYARTKNNPAHVQARHDTYMRNKDKWHEKERAKRKAFNEKWKHPCEKCGESRLYLIQFHHIDPAEKLFCIGASATAKRESELIPEIKKCVCLCSNCHDEFHYFYGARPLEPRKALEEYLGMKLPIYEGKEI